jgi:hypothetical protein
MNDEHKRKMIEARQKARQNAPKSRTHCYSQYWGDISPKTRTQGATDAPGTRFLNKYFDGNILSLKQAVLAKCSECTCFYADGRADCQGYTCPLYPYMPYGLGRKKK